MWRSCLIVIACMALCFPDIAIADPPSFSEAARAKIPFAGRTDGEAGEGQLAPRHALVIGINKYNTPQLVDLGDLTNAENDAEAIGNELDKAGFQVRRLTVGAKKKFEPNRPETISRNEILSELAMFINIARTSAVTLQREPIVVVYFAGHGLSFNGKDYIIPSDFDPKFAEDLDAMAIPVPEILQRLSWAHPVLRVFVSDACRSLKPSILKSISGVEDVALAAMPGNINLKGLGTLSDAPGKNDTFLFYATLANHTASDLGSTVGHGKFASALLDVMHKTWATSQPDHDNQRSALSAIAEAVSQKLTNDPTNKQASEATLASGSFLLLPTYENFKREWDAWDRANNFTQLFKGSSRVSERDIAAAAFCSFRRFLDEAGRYSYYGSAAAKGLERYKDAASDCPDVLPATQPSAAPPPFQRTPATGWTANRPFNGAIERDKRIRFAQYQTLSQADAPTTTSKTKDFTPATIGMIRHWLPPSSLADIMGFADDTAIDSLAITSAKTQVNRSLSNSAKSADLDAGEFVSVEKVLTQKSNDSPGYLQVKTSGNQSGVVRQDVVDLGRVAVKFSLKFPGDNGGVIDFPPDAEALLSDNLIFAIQILYPANKKLAGLSDAQLVSEYFVRRFSASPVPVVPQINRTGDEASDLTIVVKLMPLTRDLRARVALLSSNVVVPDQAVDLTDVAGAGTRLSNQSGECGTILSSGAFNSGGSEQRPTTAYLQYGLPAQLAQADSIRQTLKLAGVNAPGAEFVKQTPNKNEIRVCRDQDMSVAAKISNALAACRFGQFTVKKLPVCKSVPKNTTVEIWLSH